MPPLKRPTAVQHLTYCKRVILSSLHLTRQMNRGTIVICRVSLRGFSSRRVLDLIRAATAGSLVPGGRIYGHIIKSGLRGDVFIQNHLIRLYVNSGNFLEGVKVFDHMLERNLISWTLIISAAVNSEEPETGIAFFQRMRRTGLTPNEFALGSIVKGCVLLGAGPFGLCSHCLSVKTGVNKNRFVGSSILSMYAKLFGRVEESRKAFEDIARIDTCSSNAMMGAYASNGLGPEALGIFRSMMAEGIDRDGVTFINALRGCAASAGCFQNAKQIHGLLIKNPEKSGVPVTNCLVDVYFFSEEPDYALKTFDGIPEKDVVSWNTLLSNFSDLSDHVTTRSVKGLLLSSSHLTPDPITFSLLFKYCGTVPDPVLGFQLLSLSVKLGFFSVEDTVVSSLVGMLSSFGETEIARSVFDGASSPNTVIWNEMISGYSLNHRYEESMILLRDFVRVGLEGNESTYAIAFDVCSGLRDRGSADRIHGSAVKVGFITNEYVMCASVRCYYRCGNLGIAVKRLDGSRSGVAWGTLFSELVRDHRDDEAASLLRRLMGVPGWKIDEYVAASILGGCAAAAAYHRTQCFHAVLVKLGFHECAFASSSLINAYAKSGDVERATAVFRRRAPSSDVVVSNAMIAAYADHGLAEEAAVIFEAVRSAGVSLPSRAALMSALSACGHSGRVELGSALVMASFREVGEWAALSACFVDMLSRRGFLEEAKVVLERGARATAWRCFLSGCRIHERREMAESAVSEVVRLVTAGGKRSGRSWIGV